MSSEAEAEKILREMELSCCDTFQPSTLIIRSDAIALLRELVERREGDRWIPCSEKMPLIGAHVQTYDPTYSEHYRINTGVYGGGDTKVQEMKAILRRLCCLFFGHDCDYRVPVRCRWCGKTVWPS